MPFHPIYTRKITKIHHFWTFTHKIFIVMCVNPSILPCILSGRIQCSILWVVHPCTEAFEDILLRKYLPKTEKTSFFQLVLFILHTKNNFTVVKLTVLMDIIIIYHKIEKKLGVTMLIFVSNPHKFAISVKKVIFSNFFINKMCNCFKIYIYLSNHILVHTL